MPWRDHAACLEEDPELFFPIGNTGPALLQIGKGKNCLPPLRSRPDLPELGGGVPPAGRSLGRTVRR
jgi:hypothetical protein